jgi:hypothetical protein
MTDEHYKRITDRIRREIRGTLTTSLWIAIALSALTLGASLLITVQSASLSEGTQGEMELGYWVCFAFTGFCVFVHRVTGKDADARADDVLNEIETHLFRVPHDVPAREQ